MAFRALVLVAVALGVAGCTLPIGGDPAGGPATIGPTLSTPEPIGPPIVWGGGVVDARSGEPVSEAVVRLDLAQVRPCARQGIAWTTWAIPVSENGTFGPFETARPRTDEVAFFLHVDAPGYARADAMIGPAEARAGTANLTIVLHPRANVSGSAPPGTLLALDSPGFPRLAVADNDGRYVFEDARHADTTVLAATDVPQSTRLIPPATFDARALNETGWRLEGALRLVDGTPLGGDVVAWNATGLASAARANETGTFTLPLVPEPAELRIEARTADGQYGGALVLDLNGPPALRETVLMRKLC